MKKYIPTIVIACAAMFLLGSCSKSTPEMLIDTLEELDSTMDNPNLTEEEALAAFEHALEDVKKIAEKVKENPEQAKKDFAEFRESGKADKIRDLITGGSKAPAAVTKSPKVQGAALTLLFALAGLEQSVK